MSNQKYGEAVRKKREKCPDCGSRQGDLRWPVIMVHWGWNHEVLFCSNCGWDNVEESRKMTREEYEFFWQRFRMAWGNHLQARPMAKSYHAPQTFFNVQRVFVCPRWLEKHYYSARNWLRWEKHFHEVEFPNHSLFSFWEYKKDTNPAITMLEYVALRKLWDYPPDCADEPESDPEWDYGDSPDLYD